MVNQEPEDIGTATLNALVNAVVNQNPDYSKVEIPMTENIYKDHSVLAVIALKDRRIRIYDSLSNLRNMDSSPEIQKLAVMLLTFLFDSGFFEQTSRTDWPNLDAYRDKLSNTTQLLNTNPFNVEYVQNITQQYYDSLECEIFVVGYAEYISKGMSVPSVGFEAAYHRMRYACLLRNYGLRKEKKGYVSENEDPLRPRPTKHSIPDEMAIVRIGEEDSILCTYFRTDVPHGGPAFMPAGTGTSGRTPPQ
ncbi:hypothetical protein CQW23_03774 [Capsicum baccatum]|uniref:Ubiquitin-like protease family profile domain-containing protein n=1 Tax=Capsicum baccatum TaxID=33114 RepID=A0A2G2XCS0_CAPBA|nr:hypothetical protein CQW23_03774 [Capsicum baccatum]